MIHDDLIRVLRTRADQAIRFGSPDEARAALEQLEASDPVALETRGLRLDYLLRVDALAEAGRLAEQLVAQYPDSARIRLSTGRWAFRVRRYREALLHFTESDRIHPSPRTREWLGKTLTNLKRYDEAEALLTAVCAERPYAWRHLAWLHELRGATARAIAAIGEFLKHHPQDAAARDQLLRLRARMATPEEMVEELENLTALGEEISPQLIPECFQALLTSGQAARARAFLDEHRAGLTSRMQIDIGWRAYRAQAYDIAFALFLARLPERLHDEPLRCALEVAARRFGRVAELLALYTEVAGREPRFHGLALRLRRYLSRDSSRS